VILWGEGELRSISTPPRINAHHHTKNTTGLLMEAMRLMDESSRDAVETQYPLYARSGAHHQ